VLRDVVALVAHSFVIFVPFVAHVFVIFVPFVAHSFVIFVPFVARRLRGFRGYYRDEVAAGAARLFKLAASSASFTNSAR
jgi:hypothetical protein